MRKRPGSFSEEDLTRVEPGEPRELTALQHNVAQLQGEILRLRSVMGDVERRADAEVEAIERNAANRAQQLDEVLGSASWRLTAPLRAIRRRLRGG